MPQITREQVLSALSRIGLPDGRDLVSADMVRALGVLESTVKFVIEAPSPEAARAMEPVRAAAEAAVRAIAGVTSVSVVLTAHGPSAPAKAAPSGEPPSLKIGRHPTPQAGPAPVAGVDRIIAIGSGKGGVGKSTVASNLAVALARAGQAGRAAGCRYLRPLAAAHDGRQQAPGLARRQDHHSAAPPMASP